MSHADGCAPHLAMLRPALGFCTGAEAFGERVRYVRHSAGSGLRVGGISPRVLLLGLPTTTATAQWATAFGARGVWSATGLFMPHCAPRLQVVPAPLPSAILWENLAIRKSSRLCRRLVTLLVGGVPCLPWLVQRALHGPPWKCD